MQADCLFRRRGNIAFRTIEDTTFLVNPATKKIYPLDEVGRVIWESLGEEKSCAAIVRLVQDEFEVDPETAKKDILEFLGQLCDDGLIERSG